MPWPAWVGLHKGPYRVVMTFAWYALCQLLVGCHRSSTFVGEGIAHALVVLVCDGRDVQMSKAPQDVVGLGWVWARVKLC
jgi:hypothetical protein